MRIWLLNHYIVPPTVPKGTTHAILANTLQGRGHEVVLFPGSINGYTEDVPVQDGDHFVDRFHHDVRYRYVRTRPFRSSVGRFLNMLSYRKHIKKAVDGLEPPDVVVGSCVHPWAVDAGVSLAKRFDAAFVYQIRDIWPDSLVELGVLSSSNPICWHMRSLERRAFRNATTVTGVIPGIVDYAEGHGVPRERVRYLPNAIEPSAYPSSTVDADKESFVVSYFGAHGAANGLRTVLKAAQILQSQPKIQFQLIGNGPEKASLQELANDLGLTNVEFRDSVSKPELVGFAQQSDCFVFHLQRIKSIEKYGLGANKLVDYLLAARPIVFACQSLNNPVDDAQAGISIRCEDPTAMANAINSLALMSPSERDACGKRGREYALERYAIPNVGKEWEEFLEYTMRCHQPVRKSTVQSRELTTARQSERLCIIGCGGHAKVVIQAARAAGFEVSAIYDDDPEQRGRHLMGVEVVGPVSDIPDDALAIVAIGSNDSRYRLSTTVRCRWATIIHPSATVDASAVVGAGSMVMAGCVVQADANVGQHVILNTSATVDHDASVGDFCHLCPGVHLAGDVCVGNGVLMGIASSAIPGVYIGEGSTIGAGAVVVNDIPQDVIAAGVPARELRQVTNINDVEETIRPKAR